jgi:hypothetical protein
MTQTAASAASLERIDGREALLHGDGVGGHPDLTVRMQKPVRGRLDWIIVGGESGPNARPAHPDWFRAVRDQCAAAGTAFFFKQWGEWAPMAVCRDLPGNPVMVRQGDACVRPDGRFALVARDLSLPDDFEGTGSPMRRIGKARAGRLLDGVEHNARELA